MVQLLHLYSGLFMVDEEHAIHPSSAMICHHFTYAGRRLFLAWNPWMPSKARADHGHKALDAGGVGPVGSVGAEQPAGQNQKQHN